MITTRGAAGRAVVSFTRQVTLSVLGTLAATVVVTALKSEWGNRMDAPRTGVYTGTAAPLPSLTRGGKFAERALSDSDPEPFVIVTNLPPILPLFTAAAVPPMLLADVRDDVIAGVTLGPAERDAASASDPAPAQPVIRHARPRIAALPPARPRHAEDGVLAMAPLPVLLGAMPEEPDLWSRSKTAYRQVATWTGTLVDTLVP